MGRKLIWLVFLFATAAMYAGCSGDDNDSTSPAPTPAPDITGQSFVDAVVENWLGVDFSFQNPDGASDSDGDGEIDTNDAVDFIETLKTLGYDVPETTVDGLYNNYYTRDGYAQTDESSKINFAYNLDSPASQSDLQAYDFSNLEVGDMIFVDYDKDFVWDICALYLGEYAGDEGTYAHAAIFASDYYDKVVVVDLDDDVEILSTDIQYGYSDVKKPYFDHFEQYYSD